MNNTTSLPAHEKLFDDICEKLNELSQRGSIRDSLRANNGGHPSDSTSDSTRGKPDSRWEQLKHSQDELRAAQLELEEKLFSFGHLGIPQAEFQGDLEKLQANLDLERANNAKTSSDLAKSLELNLKLQFEIEEIRTRTNQMIQEEKRCSKGVIEKNDELQSDLDQAADLFNSHSQQQTENLKCLTAVAERKIIELKMALDKKTQEVQNIASHMDYANSQIAILKQENAAIKEYAAKMTALHNIPKAD